MRGFPGVLLLLTGACGLTESGPPNVILIVVDTLRADRLGAYGYPRPTSPVIDALAAEGMLFTDVTAQAGWTLPSMVSMFTGRYLTAYRDAVPDGQPSLPEVFQAADYTTVGVVANLSMNHRAGFARGFDAFDLAKADPWPGDVDDRPRTIDDLVPALWRTLDPLLESGDAGHVFLFLHPYDPHDPYYGHPDLDEELPAGNAMPVAPLGWREAEMARIGPAAPVDDPGWRRALAATDLERGRYDQEVRHTDQWLGRVLDGLGERGLLSNAVVALASDHGEGLWEHVALRVPKALARSEPDGFFYPRHGAHLYEEALRTPLILWGRGVPAGVVVGGAVENVDIAPTLAALAGIEGRGSWHGRNLRAPGGAGKQWVFSLHHDQAMVRETASGLKLIRPFERPDGSRGADQLFHLPTDEHERSNLADERPFDVQRLGQVLEKWIEGHPTAGGQGAMDEEQRKLLRALGYTEEDIGR